MSCKQFSFILSGGHKKNKKYIRDKIRWSLAMTSYQRQRVYRTSEPGRQGTTSFYIVYSKAFCEVGPKEAGNRNSFPFTNAFFFVYFLLTWWRWLDCWAESLKPPSAFHTGYPFRLSTHDGTYELDNTPPHSVSEYKWKPRSDFACPGVCVFVSIICILISTESNRRGCKKSRQIVLFVCLRLFSFILGYGPISTLLRKATEEIRY